jgi:hypothetical protein
MEKTSKPVPLTAMALKNAAVAGVKPAALITRLPNDRAVPKPAFELTEKKLNPKAGAGTTKKKMPARTRVRKTAPKAKPASAKKVAQASKPRAPAKKPLIASGGQKPSAAVAKSQSSPSPSQ